jgi:hypothetical protein
MDCPTFDGGSTFEGRVIEPVVSDVGGATATCSVLEWDVQPDNTRQAKTNADKANERMRTRTQDNRDDDRCISAPLRHQSLKLD